MHTLACLSNERHVSSRQIVSIVFTVHTLACLSNERHASSRQKVSIVFTVHTLACLSNERHASSRHGVSWEKPCSLSIVPAGDKQGLKRTSSIKKHRTKQGTYAVGIYTSNWVNKTESSDKPVKSKPDLSRHPPSVWWISVDTLIRPYYVQHVLNVCYATL